jgi:ketohexokinase
MARVLGVGVATVDVVFRVDAYPQEDAEVRALGRRVLRGGNASNTLVVLSQLGHDCAFAGVLAGGEGASVIREDLARYRVDARACRTYPDASPPSSCIVVSAATGSRTIVHHRDLPELTAEDFAAADLSGPEWVHFEGRNVAETQRMLERVRRERPGLPCSLEVEKPRPGIEDLVGLADVVLFSRHYALATAHPSAEALLVAMRPRAPGATLVCAWGEAGARALSPGAVAVVSPAYPPPRVVDTVAAGDVFNAGVLDALIRGEPLEAAIATACRLAGRKCGQIGLEGLAKPGPSETY